MLGTCTATTTWHHGRLPLTHSQQTTHRCTLTGGHELHRCACGIQWRTIDASK